MSIAGIKVALSTKCRFPVALTVHVLIVVSRTKNLLSDNIEERMDKKLSHLAMTKFPNKLLTANIVGTSFDFMVCIARLREHALVGAGQPDSALSQGQV